MTWRVHIGGQVSGGNLHAMKMGFADLSSALDEVKLVLSEEPMFAHATELAIFITPELSHEHPKSN